MGGIAAVLNRSGQRPAGDLVLKFLEHFAAIRRALEDQGLWDEADGLYYDRLVTPSGRVRAGAAPVHGGHHPGSRRRGHRGGRPEARDGGGQAVRGPPGRRSGLSDTSKLREAGVLRGEPGEQRLLLSLSGPDRLERLLGWLFNESEFLSPHGLRALSAWHREHPYEFEVEGIRASVDYEPAESTTSMFGGNSNWRGPVWFPLNYLVISVLARYHRFFGDDFTVEYPTGSGQRLPLDKVAADLSDRLISIFTRGPGRPAALLRRHREAAERSGLA